MITASPGTGHPDRSRERLRRGAAGGLSAVTKSVTEPGAYSGYPLQPMKQFLRTTSTLAHLPEMRKRLAELEKKVLELERVRT